VQDKISEEDNELNVSFRERLLLTCQKDFDIDREFAYDQISTRIDLTEEEKENKKFIMKLRYMGHVRFVGNLYLHDVIHSKIVQQCIEKLLSSSDEEGLICACELLQVTGKKLEDYFTGKNKISKFIKFWVSVEAKGGNTSSHSNGIRRMFKDILELQRNHWQGPLHPVLNHVSLE